MPDITPSILAFGVELTALTTLWAGLAIWQRDRRSPGGRLMLVLCASVLFWCVGDLLMHRGLLAPRPRASIAFLGILSLPPVFVGVAAHVAAIDLARRVPWFPLALLFPAVILYAMMHVDPWSALFITWDGDARHEGPLFPVWTLYSYALILIGVGLFLRAAARWPRRGLVLRYVALAFAVLVPLAGNVIYLYSDVDLQGDPTPVLIGLTLLPMRAAIFRSGLFDILPIDQSNLIDRLPVGVLVADDNDLVVDVNPRALEILDLDESDAILRPIHEILRRVPAHLSVRTERFRLDARQSLHCAVIVDPEPGRQAASSRAA